MNEKLCLSTMDVCHMCNTSNVEGLVHQTPTTLTIDVLTLRLKQHASIGNSQEISNLDIIYLN